jgi:hypothetical protein
MQPDFHHGLPGSSERAAAHRTISEAPRAISDAARTTSEAPRTISDAARTISEAVKNDERSGKRTMSEADDVL